MTTSDPLLSVRDLSIDYRTRRGSVHAVRDVTFDVRPADDHDIAALP